MGGKPLLMCYNACMRYLIDNIYINRLESAYDGSVTLKEVLTNQSLSLNVSGRGSADEQHTN